MRALLIPTLSAVMAFAAPAFAQSDAPKPLPTRTTVKVAVPQRFAAFAPLYVARATGEFEKENLVVEDVIIRATEAIVVLSRGEVAAMPYQPAAGFFNAVAGGSDLRIVAPGAYASIDSKQGIWVSNAFLNGRPYTPALLKGQEIATSLGYGSVQSVLLEAELQKAGLTINDIKFRETKSAGDSLLAVENNAVPFGWISDPLWASAKADKASLAFGQPQDVTLGTWIYGPAFLRTDRAAGEAFMRALSRATRNHLQGKYWENAAVVEPLAKEIAVEVSVLKNNAAVNPRFVPSMMPPTSFVELTQKTYLLTPNVLSYAKPLPMDQVVDESFARAVSR